MKGAAVPLFGIRVPSRLAGGDFGCGVPMRPFVRPERPGWGEGVTFVARSGREVAHLPVGPDARVFQEPPHSGSVLEGLAQ